MRTIMIIAVLFSAAGCRYAPFEPVDYCTTREGAFFSLETPGDCTYYQALTTDTYRALINNGFATEAEIQHAFVTYDIWVSKGPTPTSLNCLGKVLSGCTHYYDTSIGLPQSGGALMHEMMHAILHERGTVSRGDNNDHTGWGEMGGDPNHVVYLDGHPEQVGSVYNVTDIAADRWDWIYLNYSKAPYPDWQIATPAEIP